MMPGRPSVSRSHAVVAPVDALSQAQNQQQASTADGEDVMEQDVSSESSEDSDVLEETAAVEGGSKHAVVFSVRAKKRLNLLYEMGDEPDRPAFVEHVIKAQEDTGLPMPKIPAIGKVTLDLYRFYKFIQSHGGFVEAHKRVSWVDIAGHLGITNPNRNQLSWLKKQYVKFILPYEAQFDRGGVDPESLVQAGRVVAMSTHSRKLNGTKTPALAADEAMSAADTISENQDGTVSPSRTEFRWLECATCKAEKGFSTTFKRKAALSRHMERFHPSQVKPRYKFACHEEHCGLKFLRLSKFLSHLDIYHDMPGFEVSRESFYFREDFEEWKTAKLEESCTQLNRRSVANNDGGERVMHLLCFRSRCFTSRYPGSKNFWTDCPAFMKVTEYGTEPEDDKSSPNRDSDQIVIKVEYCLQHYGHDPENDLEELQKRAAPRKKDIPKPAALPTNATPAGHFALLPDALQSSTIIPEAPTAVPSVVVETLPTDPSSTTIAEVVQAEVSVMDHPNELRDQIYQEKAKNMWMLEEIGMVESQESLQVLQEIGRYIVDMRGRIFRQENVFQAVVQEAPAVQEAPTPVPAPVAAPVVQARKSARKIIKKVRLD